MAIAAQGSSMAPAGQVPGVTLSWQMDHYRKEADKYREMRDLFTKTGAAGKAEMCTKMIEIVQEQFEVSKKQQEDAAREQQVAKMQPVRSCPAPLVNACIPNQGMQTGGVQLVPVWPMANNVTNGMVQSFGVDQIRLPWEFGTSVTPFSPDCGAPHWDLIINGGGNPIASSLETSWKSKAPQDEAGNAAHWDYSGTGQRLESTWASNAFSMQYPDWDSKAHHQGSQKSQESSSRHGESEAFGIDDAVQDNFRVSSRRSGKQPAQSQSGQHGRWQGSRRRHSPQRRQMDPKQKKSTLTTKKVTIQDDVPPAEKPFPLTALPKAMREALQREEAKQPSTIGYSVTQSLRRGVDRRSIPRALVRD